MLLRSLIAGATALALISSAEGRPHQMARIKCVGLFCGLVSESAPSPVAKQAHYKGHRRVVRRPYVPHARPRNNAPVTRAANPAGEIVAHPAGCPHIAFCGCGTAVKVFGAPIRALWLARNWLRFPPAEPAPGMIAVRRDGHHVFAIERVIDRDHVWAYDPNSGNHLTREHVVNLRGRYWIRNPRGA
jgi:hypothetical protein